MATESELFHGIEAPVGQLASRLVAAISCDATLHEVCRKLAAIEGGALLVADEDDNIMGLVTERDIVTALAQGAYLDSTTAGDIASRGIIWVPPEATCAEAITAMVDSGTRHLGVGGPDAPQFISTRDIMGALADG